MSFTEILGLVAGFFITVSFVPQIIRVVKLRSAHEISVIFTLTQLLGLALWLSYGFILNLLPVVVCNIVLALFVLMLLGAKLKYGRG